MSRIRTAERLGWRRVKSRRFKVWQLDEPDFIGHVVGLDLLEVDPPLWVDTPDGHRLCVADSGFVWIQHFPVGSHYVLTTQIDTEGQVAQFYFDICLEHGVDKRGIPWHHDLYLDIVSLPSGGFALLDEEDLETALQSREITQAEYDLAYREARGLLEQLRSGKVVLLQVALEHFTRLTTDPVRFPCPLIQP